MVSINEDMTVLEVIESYPETMDVFVENNMEMLSDHLVLSQIGPFLTLKNALKTKNIDVNLFLELLNERICCKKEAVSVSLEAHLLESRKLNLLALLPCPVKVAIEKELDNFIRGNGEINYCIEGNANTQLSYDDYIDKYRHIDEMPDIVITPGFNNFYYKNFTDKFIDKGYFEDAAEYEYGSFFQTIGYRDPGKDYTMLAMNLSVMVVDQRKLGDIAPPKRWGDLLGEDFTKKVAIRGQKDFFCETVLLNYYRDYGIDGIKKLGRAVKMGVHPSEMVKLAGTGKEESPAVSVMPYFYARTIVKKEGVSIIWPEDGALVNPITLLVKKSSREKLKDIIDFLTGPKIGQVFGTAFFPSPHPEVDNTLPEEIMKRDIAFKWPGWDFLKANDMGAVMNTINTEFIKSFREAVI